MTISFFDFFVGVDEAKDKYDLCIVDSNGEILLQKDEIEYSSSGIQQIFAWVTKFSQSNFDRIALASEKPHGSLVDTLVERGVNVYSINPKQVDRFRDRYTTSDANDDRFDAYVIADSLRTDLKCFKKVKVSEAVILELREISRHSDELTKEKVRITNRIGDQIHRFFPLFFKICPDLDKEWSVDFLKLIISGKRIQRNHITKLFKKHHVRRIEVDEALKIIKSPFLTLAPGTLDGIIFRLDILADQLQILLNARKKCEKKLKELLKKIKMKENDEDKKYSDVEVILSMPGIADIIASILLTESGELLTKRDYSGLRTMTGIAPITKRSGKKMKVCMRRSCNKRLRNAMYNWARCSKQNDEKCREYYWKAREKGHSHGRALRGLADRLLRILISMLRSNTLYESNHNQQLNTNIEQNLPTAA